MKSKILLNHKSYDTKILVHPYSMEQHLHSVHNDKKIEKRDKKERILIVDDLAINIKTLISILKNEYEISAAVNGPSALEIVASTHVDLILLDVMMPEMDGYEVCRRLKADKKTCSIPVIFITANDEVENEIQALELGAVDFITKPIVPALVLARLKTHLGLIRAMAQVRKKTEDLEITNSVLNDTIVQLSNTTSQLVHNEKMASLGRLVAGFAHEINTPIGISITLISNIPEMTRHLQQMLVHDEVDEDELNSVLAQLNRSADLGLSSLNKAANLVSRFKRMSVDQTSEEARTFNVKEVLKDITLTVGALFSKSNINIELLCPEDLVVYSYPGLIGQILTNFLMNSHKHGFDNGLLAGEITITVQFDTPSRKLHLRYADNGRGIPKKNIPVIFEPFFTTARDSGGTGLGLTICYNIINQLQGEIVCHNDVECGVIFDVHIPIPVQSTEQKHP
ncbi:MAG: hybrid sensor histidine kinase/response regulator [Magnetococcus sp. YQC-5]